MRERDWNNLQTPSTRVCCHHCIGIGCLIAPTVFLLRLGFVVVAVQESVMPLATSIFATRSIGFTLTNPVTRAQTRKAQIAFLDGIVSFGQLHLLEGITLPDFVLRLSEGTASSLVNQNHLLLQSSCSSSCLLWSLTSLCQHYSQIASVCSLVLAQCS